MSGNVLVTGSKGMLGRDLVSELVARGWEVSAIDVEDLDIADPSQTASIAAGAYGHGGWLVNCAAYTAVDQAEFESERSTLVNAIAPGYLAQAARQCGKRMVHLSTDFVFDGAKLSPYKEDDPVRPLSAYGRTKLEGEEAVMSHAPDSLVVRTAWLFGPKGSCFPKAIRNAYESGKDLRVVADQTGCPTYTADLSRVIVDLMERDARGGIYHAAGPEAMTWHLFAKTILKAWCGKDVKVEPIPTEGWPTPAQRPQYSVMSFEKCRSLGIEPMRSVIEALKEFWDRVRQEEESAYN